MAATNISPAAANQCPEDWREIRLGSVADVRFSSVDKLTYPSEEPVRLCNYTDVYNNDYITSDLKFMRASAMQPEIDRFRLQIGDVILTKDSETPDDIGVPAVVDYAASDLVCGYHLGLIRPNKNEVDPTFLAKQLGHQRIARYFGQQANGLTRYGLPIGAVMAAPVWLPVIREQQAVGVILRLVDAAIAQTEAVITKLKQIRAGLLHDLLTRGLDEHGQLRPSPAEAPHLYQDSPLGKIPREWGVRTLRDCLIDNPQNGIYKPAGAIGRGTLLIGQTSITDERLIDVSLARRVEISDQERERYGLHSGDILVSRVFATLNGVGQPALVSDLREPAVYESNMMRLRVRQEVLAPALLFHWLRNDRVRAMLLSGVNLSNQASINQQALNRLLIMVPPAPEQEQMLRTICVLDESTQATFGELNKLIRLKSGLIADLLTGRVRVPAELDRELA